MSFKSCALKVIASIKRHPTYFWPPIWVILGIVLGLVFISYNNKNILNIGAAFIWSMACFTAGALAGMIFGVPNDSSPNQIAKTAAATGAAAALANTASVPSLDVPAQTENSSVRALTDNRANNTNLTQISDWLTKVIIGAGLVELSNIPPFVLKVSKKMGIAIAKEPFLINQVGMISGGILIYNTSFGFISGYLLMRIIFAEFI